jgi:rubrerythrin
MKKDEIHINTNIEFPDLDASHELRAVLSSALKSRAPFKRESRDGPQAFWPAEHFNLDRIALFRDASAEQRKSILDGCCRDALEEVYWIEKCGMHFAAKMSLLAASAQEKMLYSLFASDEAVHFNWISDYVAADETRKMIPSQFIKLLSEILQNEDRLTLTCIIQVILEGWGISHYHRLARDCEDEGLKKIFDHIIKDEARHHASGLILFNEQPSSSSQIKTLAEIINRLLHMVRIGPQSLLAQVERVKGPLSRAQKIRAFEDLQCEFETTKKLETLKALIRSTAPARELFDELEPREAFKPYSASECAAFNG